MFVECSTCHSRFDVSGRAAGTRVRCRCGTLFVIPKASDFAGTLKCPRCGGPCRPDQSSCEHCSAALALVACPRCLGRVFAGAEYCERCGAQVQVFARALDSAAASGGRSCPRCKESGLVANLVEDCVLDECHRCGGVWMESAAFDRLVKDKDRQAAILNVGGTPLQVDGQRNDPAGAINGSFYIDCPECGLMMNRRNFAKVSGVVIDVCSSHGIWFDRDELGRVVQFALSGGLDQARKIQLERLEQEIAEKQRALKEQSAAALPLQSGRSAGPTLLLHSLGLIYDFLKR